MGRTALESRANRCCDAARETFVDRGYDGATLAAIAAKVGVSPAALLRHARTKQDLFVACMGAERDDMLPLAFLEQVSGGEDPAVVLRRVAETMVPFLEEKLRATMARFVYFKSVGGVGRVPLPFDPGRAPDAAAEEPEAARGLLPPGGRGTAGSASRTLAPPRSRSWRRSTPTSSCRRCSRCWRSRCRCPSTSTPCSRSGRAAPSRRRRRRRGRRRGNERDRPGRPDEEALADPRGARRAWPAEAPSGPRGGQPREALRPLGLDRGARRRGRLADGRARREGARRGGRDGEGGAAARRLRDRPHRPSDRAAARSHRAVARQPDEDRSGARAPRRSPARARRRENAERERKRQQALLASGIVGQQAYDAAATAAQTAAETLREAERGSRARGHRRRARRSSTRTSGSSPTCSASARRATVAAPADGVIESMDLRPGDLVGANQPVAKMLEPDAALGARLRPRAGARPRARRPEGAA